MKSKGPRLEISDAVKPPMYGFHTFMNQPFGRAYMSTSDLNMNSRIISHEIFEMIVNPKLKFLNGLEMEVCDPVLPNSFEVDGIQISDWVYPSWFLKTDPPYNKMETLKMPELVKGGYIKNEQGVLVQ
jgi:hypothetical protein